MSREPKDELIGFIVIAIAIGLSLIAGGVLAVIYGFWVMAVGLIIFVLLRRRSKGSTLAAIILLPAVILARLLPKDVRNRIEEAGEESEKK